MSWVCMRCGFINEDDSSFICDRCNNNQPFQCEIVTKSPEDGKIPTPPGEGSEEEWGAEDQTEDDDVGYGGEKDDNEEEEWDDGSDEDEWDDEPPEPEDDDKEAIVAPTQDICPKCSRKTKEHWTNCAYCGIRLGDGNRDKCPSCGKPLKKGWALCAYCGNKC